MSIEYTTAERRNEPIKFKLDGREFEFNPPKIAMHILDMMDGDEEAGGAMLDWLGNGLSEEDDKFISDRLRDPADKFDMPDLIKLIQMLLEKVIGRPTKSRSGLRRPR